MFPPHASLELRHFGGVRTGRVRRSFQAAREAQPASGLRDEAAARGRGLPAATGGILGHPPLCGGCNLGRRGLGFLPEFQVADCPDLDGGNASQSGRLEALLGTVAEVGEAGGS